MSQRRATWSRSAFTMAVTGQKQLKADTWWVPTDGGLYIKLVAYSGPNVVVLLTPGACTC